MFATECMKCGRTLDQRSIEKGFLTCYTCYLRGKENTIGGNNGFGFQRQNQRQQLPVNKIIQGDCLEAMKRFPSESVDLGVTSPPYNLGKEYEEELTVKEYLPSSQNACRSCTES